MRCINEVLLEQTMPLIRNFLTTQKQDTENSHDGSGPISLYEIWERDDFNSNIDFIGRASLDELSS